MFETKICTHYDGGINLGHAVILMNRNNHAAMVDFVYRVDGTDNWHFYYENGTCLTAEEKTELENWFIACG